MTMNIKSEMTSRVLKAGTVVHVAGFPVVLQADVDAASADGNWELISIQLQHDAQASEVAQKSAENTAKSVESRKGGA